MKEKLFHVAGFPNVLVPMKGPSVNEHLYVCRKGYRVHHALNRHIQSVADADYIFINIVASWPGIVLTTRSYGAIVIWQLTWSKDKLSVDCWVIVPIHCRRGYWPLFWIMWADHNGDTTVSIARHAWRSNTCLEYGRAASVVFTSRRIGGSMMFPPKHCRPPLSWGPISTAFQ